MSGAELKQPKKRKNSLDGDDIDFRASKKLKGLSFDQFVETKKKIQPVVIEGFTFDPLDDRDAALIEKLKNKNYRVLTDVETDMEWLYKHTAKALILTQDGKTIHDHFDRRFLTWTKPVASFQSMFLSKYEQKCPPSKYLHNGTWAESFPEWKRRDDYLGKRVPDFSSAAEFESPVALSLGMQKAKILLHSKKSGKKDCKVLLYDIVEDIGYVGSDMSRGLSYAHLLAPTPDNFVYEIWNYWLQYDRTDPVVVLYAMWLKLVLTAKFKTIERKISMVESNWEEVRWGLHVLNSKVKAKLAQEMDTALFDVMHWLKVNDVPITLKKA